MSKSASSQPFLDELKTAEKTCGLYLFKGFLSPDEADDAMAVLNSDQFPWDLKPRLFGEKLEQHAYLHTRNSKKVDKSEGLKKLETICKKLEGRFDGKISDVFCNRFEDPTHNIDWHKDTYGRHIFVLSLGSQRRIQFRNNKTKEVEGVAPSAGDLYFMPLSLNSTHQHRVCAAKPTEDVSQAGTRLSFVFFFQSPSYAKEFKISTGDKIKGFFESILE